VRPMFSQGMIYAPARDSQMVIDEMAMFPAGNYDDLTDSATQALKYLRAAGLSETDEEVHESENRAVKPLYPTMV
jgi:phage terminase large subunit-like protein